MRLGGLLGLAQGPPGAGSLLGRPSPLRRQPRWLNNVGAGIQANGNVGEGPGDTPFVRTVRNALAREAPPPLTSSHGYFMHLGVAVERRGAAAASLPSARGQRWHSLQERRGHLSRRRDDCDCSRGRSGDQNRLHIRHLWQKQAEREPLGPNGWAARYAPHNPHDRSKPIALRV